MKQENLNIEDLFRQSFDGYKIEPPEILWNKINHKLNFKQFLKADFRTFNIYYSSLIIGIITGLAVFIYDDSQNNTLITNNSEKIQVNKNVIDESIVSKNNIQKSYEIKSTPNYTEQKYNDNASIFISKQIEYQDENQTLQLPVKIQNIDPVLRVAKDTTHILESMIPFRPRPLFSITCREGCAPFELKLNNLTQGANNYNWTFGDGGKSKDKSPIYTYNYPGIYRIQLKADGEGGTAVSIIDSIIVHDKPSIKVNWPYDSECYVGEKVSLSCESQNAKRFECDFGDGTIIGKKQAEHSFKLVGQYSITVKSWSENGCFDSVKIADIKAIKNENRIVFPSAFCPSPDGPSLGKYYERESHIDIFHPLTNVPVAEYKLIIYSREGAVVFETKDIKIGWDGYFEKRLMPEGVYPYIAAGKFEGGKDFLIKGNLTIIIKK